MPSIMDLFKNKKKELYGPAAEIIQSQGLTNPSNKPTLLDSFKNQKKELYGQVPEIIIETQGIVNPAKKAALLVASPTTVGDLIGNQIAGAVHSNANNPSDTIFPGKSFIDKPITLTKFTEAQLKTAVEDGKKYFVKRFPSIDPIFSLDLNSGDISLNKTPTELAAQTLNTIGGSRAIRDLAQRLKKGSDEKYPFYGPKFTKIRNTTLKDDITFSTHYQEYEIDDKTGKIKKDTNIKIQKREEKQNKTWDIANEGINKTVSITETTLKEYKEKYSYTNQVWVTFKKYGNSTIVPFVGAVTGITEDVQTEWSNFKYIGSPFKTYRYGGVERSLKFNLKVYYTNLSEKDAMIKKINYLKSLAFPYDTISEITYGSGDKDATSQYAFTPNLVYLSIGDLYHNIFGYIENLSFSIEDNIPWPNMNPNGIKLEGNKEYNIGDTLYPSVVDVSISMKIIENHKTFVPGCVTKYKYDFDGNTYRNDTNEFVITEETDNQNNGK